MTSNVCWRDHGLRPLSHGLWPYWAALARLVAAVVCTMLALGLATRGLQVSIPWRR